jgi:hypothetical protein
MQADTRKKLERAGWTVGDAGDFLGLTVEERGFIDVKLALADGLRQRREQLGLTQAQAAQRFGSSQSRVARMEAADARGEHARHRQASDAPHEDSRSLTPAAIPDGSSPHARRGVRDGPVAGGQLMRQHTCVTFRP